MAAADTGTVKPLQNAMKMAKVAIQLEGQNKHKDAYCEYLRTISYISQSLLEEAGSSKEKEMVAVEIERMLRLAEQCLERAKSFIGKSSEPPDPPTSTATSGSPNSSEPQQTAVCVPAVSSAYIPVDAQNKDTSPTKPGHRRVLSDGSGELSPFLPPEVFQRLQTVASQDACKKELTPIEEASRLNQKLKANYEARVARLRPGQAYQKTSMIRKMIRHQVELRTYWRKLKTFVKTLSLQRQMMENLIIAKARQDALQRKMEERRLRLQEEANRRFAASGTMSAEEQEQRLIYTNVLEYEQDHDWPKQWKAKLKKNPEESLVLDLVSYLLSRSDHPVVKMLRKHQYRIYNRLYPLVIKGPPQSPAPPLKASRSVHSLLHTESNRDPVRAAGSGVRGQNFSIDSSVSSLHSHELNDYTEDSEGEELHTQMTVERENSFEDLEQFLFQLDWVPPVRTTEEAASDSELSRDCSTQPEQDEGYIQGLEMRALKEHLKDIVKDIHIAIDQLLSLCLLSFECLNTASFKDLCLASIEEAFFAPLWSALVALFRRVHREREQAFVKSLRLYCNATPRDVGVPPKLFPQDPGALQGSYPYESAAQELKLLIQDSCPQRKLECIVRTLRLICACAEDYRCLQEVDSAPKTAAIGADDLLPILSFVAIRCQCPQLVSECAALEEFIHEGYLIGEEGYCLTSLQSAVAFVESLCTAGGRGGGPFPADKLT